MSYYSKARNLDHKTAQAWHAKRRVAERYGCVMTSADLRNVVSKIQKGEAIFKERLTRTMSKFLVTINGKEFLCVYDRSRHSIATFLPPEERS